MAGRREAARDERRRQIVDGALRVFASRGFLAATNRDIAMAAGIGSPGLIYHYFASKGELLRAVIERHSPPLQLLAHREEISALPVEAALRRIGSAFIQAVNDDQIGPCMRMMIGEASRSTEFAALLSEVGPMPLWRFLAGYLGDRMAAGLLRPEDPDAAARCFIGPLVSYMVQRRVLCQAAAAELDTHELLETTIRIFLHGMQLPAGAAAALPGASR
ncbi:MAG: TetR/AcrR family transcriptional regulator [Armatimonadetes bacterium]|nr:TetR/AcrR family transcriptional regulator [Armatimonadota bacterium]MDE2207899.1 TetR/AcrR family transcriptional regulator [Armatimonadota bacterium]